MSQEIWGFQGGQQAAMQDQQNTQLFQLKMAEGNQDLEAKTLDNQKTKAALALQDKIAKQMQAKAAAKSGGTQSPVDALADSNLEAANTALMNGDVVAADEYADKGYKLKVQDADLKIKQTEIHLKDMDITAHALDGVHDPESLKAATMEMQGLFGNDYPPLTKMLTQLQAQPYDQAKVDQLKNALVDRKAKMEEEKNAALARKDDADAKLEPIRAKLVEAEVNEHNARAEALRKNGTDSGGFVPSEGSVAAAATGMPLSLLTRGMGKDAQKAMSVLRDAAINEIQNDTPGMTAREAGEEYSRRQIAYSAGKSSSTQLTKMLGATRQAASQLNFNVDKVDEEMAKLGSSDISPVVNAIARGEEKWTGNPAYSGLFYYMTAAATESARLLSGGQASAAQLHQGASEEAQKWANVNMTPASWAEVGRSMKSEGAARLQTYEDSIAKGEIPAGAKPKDAPPPKTAVPPEGTKGTAKKSGRPIVVVDGKWEFAD